MAVLTSPRRTRPRFGPQAGLVAATRGVAFTALMAAGIGLLLMIVAAVLLIALGAGILIVRNGGPHEERVLLGFLAIGSGLGLIRFALPATLLGTRRLARLTRTVRWPVIRLHGVRLRRRSTLCRSIPRLFIIHSARSVPRIVLRLTRLRLTRLTRTAGPIALTLTALRR